MTWPNASMYKGKTKIETPCQDFLAEGKSSRVERHKIYKEEREHLKQI